MAESNVRRLEREQLVARPLPAVFAFFTEAQNLERITPPWLRFRVLATDPPRMAVGTLIEYRLRLHGFPLRWVSRIEEWKEGHAFVDRQVRGPYRLWRHRHEFEPSGCGTVVRDRVDYALPFGAGGVLANALFVRRDLERIFDYRRTAVERLLG